MVQSIPPKIDDALIARKAQLALSRLLVDRMVASAYVAPLGFAMIGWIIYIAAGLQPALLWTGGMLLIVPSIIVLGRGFRAAEARQAATNPWRIVSLAAPCVFGLGWGSSVWFVWAEGEFLLYIANLCILVGVSATNMVIMSPVRTAFSMYLLGFLATVLVHNALTQNPLALQVGVGFLVMAAVMLWTTRDVHQELAREIDSSLRNVELLHLLSKASAELHLLNGLMEEKNEALGNAINKLNDLVSHDQLTNAYSRRYIFEQLERYAATKQRHGSIAAVIMFDLDHFKAINDTYGHPVGDRVLKEAVRVVKAQLRDGDMLARVGGEEFLVLLPMTDLAAAVQLADRLRLTLEATTVIENGIAIRMPASFGVAELMGNEGYNDWYRRADTALYKAKSAGRNTLVAAG